MELPVKYDDVEDKIIDVRENKVILDSEVAKLYGAETRDINKAVKNNPDKFPAGYIFQLSKEEFDNLRWKISTTKLAKTRVLLLLKRRKNKKHWKNSKINTVLNLPD